MSDVAGLPRGSATVAGVLAAFVLASLVVWSGTPAMDELGAAGTIGLILVEAIVLNVGYGAMARASSPTVQRRLASE